MDSGAAGHVMPQTMFSHVKLERKTSPKKFLAANEEQNKDLGEKNIHSRQRGSSEVHNIQVCECCQTLHFDAKGRPSWKHCCAGRKESAHSKHSRRNNDQAGREHWCVFNGHVDLLRRNRSSFQLAGTVRGQAAFDKPVRPAVLCRIGAAEMKEVERCEEIELNGVGEERDDMADEEGDKIDDEEELAAPDWRVRAGPRNKPTQREREEHEATHLPFRDWSAHCMM